MRMNLSLLLGCLVALSACAAQPVRGESPPPQVAKSADVTAIERILESFRTAIIAKAGPALEELMLAPDVPFQSIVGTAAEPRRSTAADFIRFVNGATTAVEEKFSDVHVTVDGGLAVLDARYSFHDAGVQTNAGREVWVLLSTPRGWKIASVTWSIVRAVGAGERRDPQLGVARIAAVHPDGGADPAYR